MYPYISTPYRHYRIVAENQGNHCAREIERIKGKEERSEVQRENRRRTTSAGYRVRCVMSCDTMRCDTPEGGPEGDPISRFRIPSVDLIKTSRKLDLIIVQTVRPNSVFLLDTYVSLLHYMRRKRLKEREETHSSCSKSTTCACSAPPNCSILNW